MTAEQVMDRFTPGRIVEQEIRDAIEARLDRRVGDADRMASVRELIRQAITQGAADPLIDSAADTLEGRGEVWEPLNEPHRSALFGDLRPSEAARLVELTEAACDPGRGALRGGHPRRADRGRRSVPARVPGGRVQRGWGITRGGTRVMPRSAESLSPTPRPAQPCATQSAGLPPLRAPVGPGQGQGHEQERHHYGRLHSDIHESIVGLPTRADVARSAPDVAPSSPHRGSGDGGQRGRCDDAARAGRARHAGEPAMSRATEGGIKSLWLGALSTPLPFREKNSARREADDARH